MINYKISPKSLHGHIFEVELTLNKATSGKQVFMLPNWIAGSYLIRDFCKHIIVLKAYLNGRCVPVQKPNKNHWQINCAPGALKLVYEIYAFDLSVRHAYLTDERAFFNASSVFLLPLGFEDKICQVDISGFFGKIATTLALENELYCAKNYAHLLDCPVEIANFDSLEFNQNGITHTLTITGTHACDLDKLKQDMMLICAHHQDFFSELPFDEYLFLTLATEKDYGGLEHQNSCALICAREELLAKNARKYTRFLALISHEYFHAWWVKIIKPANFHQLDFNQENDTQQLWIFEGFTSYYDELTLLRTRILSPEQYLELFAQTLTRLQQSSGRFKQSLLQSGAEAWTKFYQQDENAPNAIVSYYTKGALLAFALDIEIRRCTQNAKSLDNVMRFVWQNYQNSGLENDDVQQVVRTVTGVDFSKFFNAYLLDTVELPLQAAFDFVGVDLQLKPNADDLSDFGMILSQDLKIIRIFENSCAQKAGLYVGDCIVSVNNNALNFKQLSWVFNASTQGECLKVALFRDGLLKHKTLLIERLPPSLCVLNLSKNISAQTQQQQKSWFYAKY
jgi:predicted metalloprotease with PDZ domain